MKKGIKNRLLMSIIITLLMVATITVIYCIKHEPWKKDQWTITEYSSTTGNQCMFYTIQDKAGRLVVIDGGYTADAENVKNVIMAHGGKVYAWVLTHPHPDHIGAFNTLYPNLAAQGITVKRVYATDVNYDRYKKTAQDYDDFASCETFYKLKDSITNLKFLHENDKLELLPGLNMKVLHAWDKNVDALNDHLCNDGSLMFKIYGKKQTMLFCGDTQKEMEPFIYKAHLKELKSDYVQCGHHGNWGLSTEFYDKVSPKLAFMDAPAWITGDGTGTYDGPVLKQHFLDGKIRVCELETAPNRIILK